MAWDKWQVDYLKDNYYIKTNRELAKEIGCHPSGVSYMANKLGMRKNKGTARGQAIRKSYKDALPPEKHAGMEIFLRMLLTYARKAQQDKVKPDVLNFITMYSVYMNGASPVGKGGRGRVSKSLVDRFLKLKERGLSYNAIAKATGVTHDTVRRHIKSELGEGGGSDGQ